MYFVSLEYRTFCCPVLGSRHCTVLVHILKQLTPPASLASLNSGMARYCKAGAS